MALSDSALSRRQWLKISAGLVATPLILPARFRGEGVAAPGERVNLGVIGVGSRGMGVMYEFIQQPEVEVVALCDVDTVHYRDREWGSGVAYGLEPALENIKRCYRGMGGRSAGVDIKLFRDYRELCALKEVDVVLVATPDHWHALCTLEALHQGKDVYCEKPVTHRFGEGQAVCREVAERKAVFQAGSQQRSDPLFRRAVELVLNGHIGAVKTVEVGLPEGYPKAMGDTTVESPPAHLDYDFWCGPAEKLPYMRARHHRWWRGHRAYGGGPLMDFIGHDNDIAHWAMGMDGSGPVRVEAVDWTRPDTEVYNTPHHYAILCEYAGGIHSSISDRHENGVKWIGEDGWIRVTRGLLDASNEDWLRDGFDPGPVKAYASPGHVRNFLDCVKSRQQCVASAETTHRSITPGHLAYVSHDLRRAIQWDPAAERVVDDEEAEKLLRAVPCRAPWKFGT